MSKDEHQSLIATLQNSLIGRIFIRIYAKGNSRLILRPEMSDKDAVIKIVNDALGNTPKIHFPVMELVVYAYLKIKEITLISFTFFIDLLITGEVENPSIEIKIFDLFTIRKILL